MKQSVSAWSGAVVGIAAASLLCVLAYNAAHERGWFSQSQTSSVRSQVYGSSVREQVYGEWDGEQMNGHQSPSNQVDKLYTPTMQDELPSDITN